MQDQDKIIKGIFLEEIVLECALNKLSIKDYKPALYFNTKIQDINKTFGDLTDDRKPVLEINNINKFLDILTEYVKEAIYFYYDGDFSHDNIKMVSSLVFANASFNDLKNPCTFLENQTSFLRWTPLDNFSVSFLGYEANIVIKKNKPILESPYTFEVEIKDGDESFFLPDILFGISNSEAFLYAIQNKDKSTSKLKKKINRLLYKINEGYVAKENESKEFSTSDVTMSFVAVAIVFIKYLKENDITNLNISTLLPLRYNAHKELYKRRIEYYNKTLPNKDYLDKYKELAEKERSYEENVTFKLYRTFKRVLNQESVLKMLTNSNSLEDGLMFEITDGVFNNDLICEIYENISSKNNIA